jgi:hypothetical protein
MSSLAVNARRATLLVLASALIYKYRRTPIGIALYLLGIAVPAQIVDQLKQTFSTRSATSNSNATPAHTLISRRSSAPKSHDILSAAFTATMRWFLLKDYASLPKNIGFATTLQTLLAKYVAKVELKHVKVPAAESRKAVEGYWIAETKEEIPSGRLSAEQAKDKVVFLYFHGTINGSNTHIRHSLTDANIY